MAGGVPPWWGTSPSGQVSRREAQLPFRLHVCLLDGWPRGPRCFHGLPCHSNCSYGVQSG